MNFRRTRVYIAGPMTGSGNPYVNIRKALDAYEVLLDRGYAPYLPHLTAYVEAAIGGRDTSVWLSLDRAFLSVCDCLLRLPGESPGSDKEVEWMKELGRPVYESLDSLCASEYTSSPLKRSSYLAREDAIDTNLFSEVMEELARATAAYGPFNSAHEGFAVLNKEIDEMWDDVRLKQSDPTRKERMRHEAIQVAAMALRFLKECC
jgi:hypothetical protein